MKNIIALLGFCMVVRDMDTMEIVSACQFKTMDQCEQMCPLIQKDMKKEGRFNLEFKCTTEPRGELIDPTDTV